MHSSPSQGWRASMGATSIAPDHPPDASSSGGATQRLQGNPRALILSGTQIPNPAPPADSNIQSLGATESHTLTLSLGRGGFRAKVGSGRAEQQTRERTFKAAPLVLEAPGLSSSDRVLPGDRAWHPGHLSTWLSGKNPGGSGNTWVISTSS